MPDDFLDDDALVGVSVVDEMDSFSKLTDDAEAVSGRQGTWTMPTERLTQSFLIFTRSTAESKQSSVGNSAKKNRTCHTSEHDIGAE